MSDKSGLAILGLAAVGLAGYVAYTKLIKPQEKGSEDTGSLGLGGISIPDFGGQIPNLPNITGSLPSVDLSGFSNIGGVLDSIVRSAQDAADKAKQAAQDAADRAKEKLNDPLGLGNFQLPKIPTGADLGKGAEDLLTGVGRGVGGGAASVFTNFYDTIFKYSFAAGNKDKFLGGAIKDFQLSLDKLAGKTGATSDLIFNQQRSEVEQNLGKVVDAGITPSGVSFFEFVPPTANAQGRSGGRSTSVGAATVGRTPTENKLIERKGTIGQAGGGDFVRSQLDKILKERRG